MIIEEVSIVADRLRSEPWKFLPMRYNCVGKTLRFRSACRKLGTHTKAVFAVVAVDNMRFPFLPRTLIGFHVWAEVDSQRIELARPFDEPSPWGCYDIDMRRVFALEI